MENTMIHLFETPNGKYMYDGHKNECVMIDDDVFKALSNDSTTSDLSTQKKIDELKKSGFLKNASDLKIEHPLIDYIELMMDRKLDNITLQLTQNCNFRCSYCAYTSNDGTQRHHSAKRMSLEMAKKGIDYLWNHSTDTESVTIGFYGGEPLIEFELLKKIVLYSEEKFAGKMIKFMITTNATLINDEIIKFFEDHKINLLISLDGPKDINDKSRVFASNGKGTFDAVKEKLCQVYKNDYFKDNLAINMVVDPKNSFEKILTLFDEGDIFSHVRVSHSVIDDYYSVEKNVYSVDFIKQQRYQYFLCMLAYIRQAELKATHEVSNSDILKYISKQQKIEMITGVGKKGVPGGPCVPGLHRLLLTVDGNFFPCERVSETSEMMKIGDIENGLYIDRVKELMNVAKITKDECKKCWNFFYCLSCAKYADGGSCLSKKKRLESCAEFKTSTDSMLRMATLFKEANTYYN